MHRLGITSRLVTAFLIVALIPLGILAYLNQQNTHRALTQNATQSLSAAASTTLANIDSFLLTNFATLETVAQLPTLISLLDTPPAQRPGASDLSDVLAGLKNRNSKYVISYTILDNTGQVVAENGFGPNRGDKKDKNDYFRIPYESGEQYVSPIYFSTKDSRPLIYFSLPIKNLLKKVVGIIIVEFDANILQDLLAQSNEVAGVDSFPILVDEDNFILGHGIKPETVYQWLIPPSDSQLNLLEQTKRLPPPTDNPPIRWEQLAQNLHNIDTTIIFTSNEIGSNGTPHKVVAMPLSYGNQNQTTPWIVLYSQPEEVFLEPIQIQTETTLNLAIIIIGIVIVAAFGTGRYLTAPIVSLTQTMIQFRAGNLEARSSIKVSDERGVLAQSFNAMAEQVGALVQDLETRTHSLENEIVERKSLESHLHKLSNALEQTTDNVVITDREGKIEYVNLAFSKVTSYTLEEVVGQTLHIINSDQHSPEFYQNMMSQLTEGHVFNGELVNRDKHGTLYQEERTITPIRDQAGQITHFVSVGRDISQRKQAEQERLKLSTLQRELAIAQQIQESLLPNPRPAWHTPQVVCYSQPARTVGGDFYCYYQFENQAGYAFAVGDVSGKGVSSALLMALCQAQLDASFQHHFSAADRLVFLDELITPYTKSRRQNCAMCYVELTSSLQLSIINAGGLPPYIKYQNGTVTQPEAWGFALGQGLGSHHGYEVIHLDLQSGDMLVLCSDGVLEATNEAHELLGFERLEAMIADGPITSAKAMLDYLVDRAYQFTGVAEQQDDITIVVVKI
ncbi:SpoIIE family protein phosphatase [Anaerolineales bacterium HSG6]|nr:SpoIIE family protein phosphatase [Anaerolineales bacterium HSG6]